MYWKFFLVNLLLVLPNTRILTSDAQDIIDYQDGSDNQFDDRLIESILRERQGDQSEENIPQDGLDKKEQTQIDQNAGSSNNAINQDSYDLKNERHIPVNNPPVESLSKAVVPPGAQVNGKASVSEPAVAGYAAELQQKQPEDDESKGSMIMSGDDKRFVIIVAMAVSTSFVGLMLAGVCYYKFRKSAKAASDVEYPVYGVTGPVKERIPSPGDRKLAQSAQMYHYQHQKQQMIAMEKANGDMKHDASDDDSEEDNIEGDYTVYECPGLAPTGEMEVRNPLFRADDTPVTPGEDITGQPHGQEPPQERGNQ